MTLAEASPSQKASHRLSRGLRRVHAILFCCCMLLMPNIALALIAQNPAATVNHEVTLSGLSPNTTYYYRIGNATGALPRGLIAVVRGPYLQLVTENAITIKWRTGVATDSLVDYRLTPFAGSTSFVTSPRIGSEKPTRIWVLGDAGTARLDAKRVRDAYRQFTGTRATDVWLMLGDNAYSIGSDINFQDKLFDIYPNMLAQVASWATFGNHDAMSANSATQMGPYFNAFTLPTLAEAGGVASHTEAYYSFDYGNIHFVCLDSQLITSTLPGSAMLTWLMNDLAANQAAWTIAFFHHPPYSKGSHDSDAEPRPIQARENIVPLLEAYGVDLVLTGHSHSYERSKLIDGHYGVSSTLLPSMIVDASNGQGAAAYVKSVAAGKAHLGAVYAVAGSSGMLVGDPTLRGLLNHPIMIHSSATLGSMVIDVVGNQLDAIFLTDMGVVLDSFTMKKQQLSSVRTPIVTAPANIMMEATSPHTVVGLGVATATDATDGVLVATPDQTGPFAVGEHQVIWRATNAANITGLALQVVNIIDTTAPVLSMMGGDTTVEGGSTYVDAGARAVDVADANVTANIVVNHAVNTAVLGDYAVTYQVTDASGNAAVSIVRTVSVVDTTAPLISLHGQSTITLLLGSDYVDAGAIATDVMDGDVTLIAVGDMNTTVLGSYVLRYNHTDASGNIAIQVVRDVHIVSEIIPADATASVPSTGGGCMTQPLLSMAVLIPSLLIWLLIFMVRRSKRDAVFL